MNTFWLSQQAGLSLFLVGLLLITLTNRRFWRCLGQFPQPEQWPRLSVLVPARNEEANIGPCLHSLLAQDYPNFEVLVLNDASTDNTTQVLAALTTEYERLRVLSGKPVPPGWLGKQWACEQLAQA